MSDRRAIILCLVGLVIVAVMLADGSRPEAHGVETGGVSMGRVAQATGGVRRRAARQLTWETLQTGDETFDNDTVFVPPGADAVVDLRDGTRLSLEPNSLIVLTAPEKTSAFSVFVARGAVVGETDRRALMFTSDRGALQVEGQARVSVGQNTSIDLYHGAAIAGGTTLNDNESVTLDGSEKRAYSAQLLAPLAGRRLYAPRVRFQWSGNGRARVSNDHVLHETEERAFELDLPPGNYSWLVVGADARPVSPTAPFAVLNDAAPRGVSPRHLELLSKQRFDAIPFLWTRTPGAQHYVLELSSDEHFSSVLRTLDTQSTRAWMTADFAEGVVYWRVRAEGRGRPPAVSSLHAFRFSHAPLPDAPEVYDAEVDLGH